MKKQILFLAFSLCVGTIFAQDANKSKSEGDEALKAKNYTEAYVKYDQYLKATNNQDSVTVYNCGLCALNIKNYTDAAKYFDISIKNNYQLPMSYAGKAQSLKNLGKNAEMLSTIQEGLKAVPGDGNLEKLYAVYYLKEGQKFQKANDLAKAEENYKNVLTISDKKLKTDAFYSLGVMMFNNGAVIIQKATPLATTDKTQYDKQKAVADVSFKKASEYLEQALALSPDRDAVKKMLDQIKATNK